MSRAAPLRAAFSKRRYSASPQFSAYGRSDAGNCRVLFAGERGRAVFPTRHVPVGHAPPVALAPAADGIRDNCHRSYVMPRESVRQSAASVTTVADRGWQSTDRRATVPIADTAIHGPCYRGDWSVRPAAGNQPPTLSRHTKPHAYVRHHSVRWLAVADQNQTIPPPQKPCSSDPPYPTGPQDDSISSSRGQPCSRRAWAANTSP